MRIEASTPGTEPGLLDAFRFQHPDRPDLSVSVPMSERLFGQGAVGTFKDFKVSTRN